MISKSFNKINRIAELILRTADDYQYIHDPEHRNKPHGKFWPTDKGWSNDPKDAPQSQQSQYPYELTPSDSEYFKAIESGNTEAINSMVTNRAKEAGYNTQAYHGTTANFNEFDTNKITKTSEGVGFYFSENPDVASGYGKVKSVFLSMNKPLAYDSKAFNKSTIMKIIKDMVKEEAKVNQEDIADGFLSNYGDVRYEGFNRVLDNTSRLLAGEKFANDQVSGIYHSGVPLPIVSSSFKKVTGYDGVVANGYSNVGTDKIYIAWSPNQIKSADPIVKDDQGNIIPLSQRFNPNSKDIRF